MKLIIEQGENAGQALGLKKSAVTIGRGSECDILLPEEGVSRQHARLRWEPSGWLLIDLGSTNGTSVNSHPLAPDTPHRLQQGDRIGIGSSVLLVLDTEPPEPVAREPSSPERRPQPILLIAGAALLVVVLVGIVTFFVLILQPKSEATTPTPMNQAEQLMTSLPVPTELQDMMTSVVPILTGLPIWPSEGPVTPPPPAAGSPEGSGTKP